MIKMLVFDFDIVSFLTRIIFFTKLSVKQPSKNIHRAAGYWLLIILLLLQTVKNIYIYLYYQISDGNVDSFTDLVNNRKYIVSANE